MKQNVFGGSPIRKQAREEAKFAAERQKLADKAQKKRLIRAAGERLGYKSNYSMSEVDKAVKAAGGLQEIGNDISNDFVRNNTRMELEQSGIKAQENPGEYGNAAMLEKKKMEADARARVNQTAVTPAITPSVMPNITTAATTPPTSPIPTLPTPMNAGRGMINGRPTAEVVGSNPLPSERRVGGMTLMQDEEIDPSTGAKRKKQPKASPSTSKTSGY